MEIVLTVFWGVLLLSFLVFIHEGGHFLMARAEGIRVTEFFLGMPCRYNLSWKSKKYGTKYGITPLFLGGYNKICGLAGSVPPQAGKVLNYLEKHGRASVDEIAEATSCTEDEVYDVLVVLTDWATVEPYYNPELGEKPGQKNFPRAFQTVLRDSSLRTEFDKGFDREGKEGPLHLASEPQDIGMPIDEFLEKEKSKTYQGKGFWKRFSVLVAGPGVNLAFGVLAIVIATMTLGVSAPVEGSTRLQGVEAGSKGEAAGIMAGDEITAVAGNPTEDWDAIVEEMDKARASAQEFSITVKRDGETFDVNIPSLGVDEKLGIAIDTKKDQLDFPSALSYSFDYIGNSAKTVASILIPTETAKVVSQSTSVVGIAVVAGEAAEQGALEYLSLGAMVSVALGLANLLPIPPLDGGKLLVEVLQVWRKRPFKTRTLEIADALGVAAFFILFVVVLRQDIVNLFMQGL